MKKAIGKSATVSAKRARRKRRTSPTPETAALEARLREAEETLSAIRNGDVDALVVQGPSGDQVFTLKGADHRYRQLVETMNEGALMLAPDGTIVYANARFAKLVGIPHEREPVVLLLSAGPVLGSQGEPLGCVVSFVDVTDAKRAAEERLRLLERANEARAEAEAANRAKDEFLAMLGHELRNPLAPILTAIELARKMRTELAFPQLRLVALTGYGTESDRERSAEAGFDSHMDKPINLMAVASTIKRLT